MGKLPLDGLSYVEVLRTLREIARSLPTHFTGFVGSMTTVPHPLAKQVFVEFMEFNANDLETYSALRELEREAVEMLGEVLGREGCDGMITTGGSEANIAALYLAREHGYEVVYAAPTAHDSVVKAAKLLRMKLVQVPHRGFRIDTTALEKAVERHGPGVIVVTMGTTGFGTVDPVGEVDSIAKRFSCVVHVDAAFGGFVAPFIYGSSAQPFGFGSVVSATMDPHKLGLCPIPCGGLVVRSSEWLEPLVFEARYMPRGRQIGLLGTRSGGSVAAAWAMLKYMGWRGFEAQARELMSRTRFFVTRCRELGLSVAAEPEVPVVCVSMENDEEALRRMRSEGYVLYRCGLVPGVRIVVGPHVSKVDLERIARGLANFVNTGRP